MAIVTGAGSVAAGMGNGKATAILFAQEGAKVMLVDYRLEAAEETKRLIGDKGPGCITFKADVSKASDCKSMVEKCIQTYGRVDTLHNNVGIWTRGGVVDTTEEDWDRVMNVNLKSMFLTCKYVIPHMEKQGSGCIINISSIAAIRAGGGRYSSVAYASSKAGVIALTAQVAMQYAAKGIRANVIMPGLIKTPMATTMLPKSSTPSDIDEFWKQRDAVCPTGKQGDAWDIAHAALFLASDEAKYITGITLPVAGGLG